MTLEQRLNALVPEDGSTLLDAARYALLGGGKRIRPQLTLDVTAHFGGDIEKALTPACAIEMIHSYSLIHDDLPCMDDDDFRRGRPTVHKQYDEAIAVLSGDYLLTRAFEVLTTAPNLTPEQRIALMQELSFGANDVGMIGGQVLDIEAERGTLTVDELKEVHAKKTGALFSAAAIFGGIVAGVDEEQIERLRRYGIHVGIAFQIQDDIKDVLDSEAKHGCTVSSDQRNEKTTYVTLVGIERARRLLMQELEQADALLPRGTSLQLSAFSLF